jgi:hypothetical protein
VETIDAKQPQRITLRPEGGLSLQTIHVWETNSRHTFERVADVSPSAGKISYTLDPDSLYTFTTTTGQGRGTAAPPANTPFPLPYVDGFEDTEVARAPRFLSDQDGAFEAHPCQHRKGRCLEQVITVKPIPWAPLPSLYSCRRRDMVRLSACRRHLAHRKWTGDVDGPHRQRGCFQRR